MKTLYRKTIKIIRSKSNFENAYEFIRIYLGIALFLKGVHFISQPEDLDFWLKQGQINVMHALISHYVITAHLVGGLFLATGAITRIASVVQIPALLGAIIFVHSNDMFFSTNQNFELTSLVLFLLILFSFFGGGYLSLDYYSKQ